MAHHRKSYKNMIRGSVDMNTVSFATRQNPNQASCQGLSVRYWWPKTKAVVIVKPPKKQLLTSY